MEKLIRNLGKKILAITVACLVGFFSLPAIAQATCIPEGPVQITNGSFSYINTEPVPKYIKVRSATVEGLPPGETGTIDEIIITGPNGKREYGCSGINNVEDGTDLVQSCGGPAVLKAGSTTYEAKGSNFQPQTTFDTFSIVLCGD